MESSSTSSWKLTTPVGGVLLREPGTDKEALIASSTRELVEFYWTNRKRFSGGSISFPSKTSRDHGK